MIAPFNQSLRSMIGISLLVFDFCGMSLAQNIDSTCPQVSIEPIGGLFQTRRKSNLRAQISSGFSEKFVYIWGLSRGRIVSGQGTSAIDVYFDKGDAGLSATVFLKIESLPEKCPSLYSEEVVIAPDPIGEPVDTFGELRPGDVKTRIDLFYISVSNNPECEGLIVATFDSRHSRVRKLRALNAILNAIRFRKHDLTRISFLIEESAAENKFVLWLVPPGADLPGEREKTTLIKGEDLIKNPGQAFPKKNCK